jgi:formylglycine-generating enzyme required for sulfatase activity
MGSAVGNVDERPVHTVDLSTFWFDSLEVTTEIYSKVVDGRVHQAVNSPAATGLDSTAMTTR